MPNDPRKPPTAESTVEGQTQRPTVDAPTLPLPAGGSATGGAARILERGETIDDFEVISILGRGAFGVVYRARQRSLDREVALKVAANRGSEGRTMARLEHRHIVQVFSETVDQATNQRLLCMQLVSGVPLDVLIDELRLVELRGRRWTGADLLSIVDARAAVSPVLDATALRDRQRLESMDAVEATAWIGARLAESLDYAHQQGVLHRDIKPANVLINRYGQPLLADFNISFQSFDAGRTAADNFGGTLAYMAPEHLAAFSPRDDTPPEAVDARSDLYSLGIVVGELLSTRFPIAPPGTGDASRLARVTSLADWRRQYEHAVPAQPADSLKALHTVVARCLSADPADRYQRGTQMMAALDGVVALRGAERDLPSRRAVPRAIEHWPFVSLVAAALVPQFVGSAFNIAYNTLEIVGRLDPAQQQAFWQFVARYNVVVYPLAVVVGWWVLGRLWQHWRRLLATRPATADDGRAARRRAMRVPLWLMLLAGVGWLPGGLLFPWYIDHVAGPLAWGIYGHFAVSFTLSGLIALAYSLCFVQYVVLRGFYIRMWPDASDFGLVARGELAGLPWRLALALALAGAIPLVAAVVYLAVQDSDESRWFRVLAISLILLGALGYQLATQLTRRVAEMARRMIG
jgi:serine/threonine protein kinase